MLLSSRCLACVRRSLTSTGQLLPRTDRANLQARSQRESAEWDGGAEAEVAGGPVTERQRQWRTSLCYAG